MAEAATPHVLIFPLPGQGQLHPMLKLAEAIATAGLNVTFLNAEAIHDRFVRSKLFGRLSGLPALRFRTLSDGLPVDDPHGPCDFLDLMDSLADRSRETYKEILAPTGSRDADGWPRVSCVVADGLFPFTLEVAEEMKIPVMIFRTSSACSVWAYYSIPKLLEIGDLPFSENTDMDKLTRGVEGMESFLRLRDLPGLMRHVASTNDRLLRFLITISSNLSRASALILNTVERLEALPLRHIRSVCPATYAVGPLHLLRGTCGSNARSGASISQWKEDRSCVAWLDRQPRRSVAYVSFGSTTVVSRESLLEFWHGLVSSGYRFLWVIRPGMVRGGLDPREALGDGALGDGTAADGKGFLVEWAPQEEVLAHPAVGCFVTHSGWNSTLESLASGVPMICWPFFADQQVNSRFVGEVWRVGIDMKDACERGIVERTVRKVMDGSEEDAEMLRRRASSAMAELKMSVEEGGSSYEDFRKLIEHIKSFDGIANENRGTAAG